MSERKKSPALGEARGETNRGGCRSDCCNSSTSCGPVQGGKCPQDVHVDSREIPADVRPLKGEGEGKVEIKERAPTADAAADPLDAHPHLLEAIDNLEALLLKVHPKAKRPKPKTKEWAAERRALGQLVTLDDFKEEDVAGTLRWLFTSNESDAAFWRKQVHAWRPLRKTKDGASKFTKIHEAMKNSKGDLRDDISCKSELSKMDWLS